MQNGTGLGVRRSGGRCDHSHSLAFQDTCPVPADVDEAGTKNGLSTAEAESERDVGRIRQ